MKKNKSISNWMSSALRKPPLSAASSGGGGSNSSKKTEQQNSTKPTTTGSLEESDMPWCQKHSPLSATDLAVHKKKVAEVQQWLEFALSTPHRTAGQLMLLLSGPPGCGKTATVRTLAREMGCTILEWANPVTDVGGSEVEHQPGDLVVYSESQTRQFQSFLIRANRYPTLQLGVAGGCGLDKKIVIVEDFPNAFLRDPHKFHEIVRSLAPCLHHPLVFIVSDGHQRDSSSSAHTLFSKSHNPLDIHTISFNPVAHTALVKTLLRIAELECSNGARARKGGGREGVRNQPPPPREVIERLAESSVGDIRSAINALQFTCRTGEDVAVETKKGQRSGVRLKRSRSGSSSSNAKLRRHASSDGGALAAIGGRDNSLFLFRALGKILYCKRETAAEGEGEGEAEGEGERGKSAPPLPPHLQHHDRPRLLVDPEWVVEHSHLSPEMFVLYLHQNYLHMHSHTDNVVRASEYLSSSDVVSTLWTDSQMTRATLLSASCSLACRGLLHTSELSPGEGGGGGASKWRPLHKPQCISVSRTYRDSCRTARRLFLHLGQSPHAHLWTPVELQTEILPHMALTNLPLRNPDQAALLQSLTHFSHGYISKGRLERLGERDVGMTLTQDRGSSSLEATDGQTGQGQSQDGRSGSLFHSVSQDVGMGPVDSPEEEAEIEDFEDDMIW